MNAYVILTGAIVAEVAATTALKAALCPAGERIALNPAANRARRPTRR